MAELDEVFKPFADRLKASGVARTQLVREMIQTYSGLAKDPVGALEQIAGSIRNSGAGTEQAVGVVRRVAAALGVEANLGAGGGNAGKPNSAEAQRIAALEEKLASYERAQRESVESATQRQIADAERAIREFAEAKAADGKPLRPYFDKVKSTVGVMMQAAVQAGEQLTLEQAYERAVWAREDLREDLIKARQGEAAKAAAATRRNSLARSKAAVTPKTSSVPVSVPSGANLSVDQLLDRGFAAMQ